MRVRRRPVPPRGAPTPPVDPTDAGGGRRVLVLTASMGAGHDGAARELRRRLEAAGHCCEVRDFLDAGPLRVGAALRSGYEFELRHVPSAYDATYRLWYRVPWLCPLVAWLVSALSRRRVLRWVRAQRPDVVVSTYPLATLALGRLRQRGRLQVPAVNFITDFGVHPLWVHRGIDLHLAVHQAPADHAARRTGRPALACGPAVSAAFEELDPSRRAAARLQLGLAARDRAVLVAAGSWGVGDLVDTVEAVWDAGEFVPVVVCGRDERARADVAAVARRRDRRIVALGWTDRMADLMAACDALVENAGGLTSLEAMRASLPVVSYHPIAGHGRENTAAMAQAGVASLAGTAHELGQALARVTVPGPQREAQVARAQAMFVADPAVAVAGATAAPPAVVSAARRRVSVATRAAAAAAALGALSWAGLTEGVAVAADAGAGVAHPPANAGPCAYLGIRLDATELTDPALLGAVRQLGATVVVDEQTAEADPAALQRLVRAGVDVASGGQGPSRTASGGVSHPAPWNRAEADAQSTVVIGDLLGRPVPVLVPQRHLNAFDLLDGGSVADRLVAPDAVYQATDADSAVTVAPQGIYILDGSGASAAQVMTLIGEADASLAKAGLTVSPLSGLR